jgi:diadenosine tetraphosphate (Ap4A) HIT family hydrolase
VNCILCETPESVGPVVFDDGRLIVLLHNDWAVAGHALVIARQHVQNASDLDPGDATHFWELYARAERAVLAVSGAERAMMLKLGIQVPHLHVHIYPVAGTATRATVFDAFDGKATAELNESQRETFVDAVRSALRSDGGIAQT